MSDDHKAAIDKHLELVCEILSLDDALLTELFGEDVLDAKFLGRISAINNLYERNRRFLNWLKSKPTDVFKNWTNKLRQHHQAYIANLLDGTPGELPLDEGLKKQLRKNIASLSDLIDTDSGIVEHLFSCGAISSREHQHLNSPPVASHKSLELLKLIITKSDQTYTLFLEALKKTNQDHITEYLQNGEIAKLHVEFQPTSNCTSDFLWKFEAFLNENFNAVAKEIKPSEARETTKLLTNIFSEKIKIIACKQTQSIVLFIWCRDDEAATELLLMYESRQLEKKLEEICSCLTISLEGPKVLIRVSMEPEFLLSLKRAAMLRNSDTTPSLEYEELLQKYSKLMLYVKQVENEIVSLQSANGELQTKIGELEVQLLTENNIKDSLSLENSEMNHRLYSMKKVLESTVQVFTNQHDTASKLETLTLSEEFELFGLAYLNTTIYLLLPQWICAYEYPNLERSYHDINIRDIKSPCDIAACQKCQRLYISDDTGRCIWRIQINDNDQRPFKWLANIKEPFTLSVTGDGCLLIPESNPNPCIKCYNTRAALIRIISLPMNLGLRLTRAIKTTTNKYVVSFCDDDRITDNAYQIFEFEDKGKAIEDSDMKYRLDTPDVSYMASGDDNWVFVVSEYGNKIIMCDGLFVCDVLNDQKDSIQRPSKLCCIKDNTSSSACSLVFIHEIEHCLAISTCNLSLNMTCVLEDLTEPGSE